MTTKRTTDFSRVAHHLALACVYVTAARKGADEGDLPWSVAELRNAAGVARDAARGAEALATSLATRRASK